VAKLGLAAAAGNLELAAHSPEIDAVLQVFR